MVRWKQFLCLVLAIFPCPSVSLRKKQFGPPLGAPDQSQTGDAAEASGVDVGVEDAISRSYYSKNSKIAMRNCCDNKQAENIA